MLRQSRRRPALWLWLLAAAGLGMGLMLLMAWQASSIELLDPQHAAARLAVVRSGFGASRPLLERNSAGVLVRAPIAVQHGQKSPTHLIVTVYQPARGALICVDVPFWMLTVKGPLLQAAFRTTGFHLKDLGLSVADLRELGACTILDETRDDGSVLIVGTR